MSVRTKHRIEFGFAGILLILALLLVRGNRAEGRTEAGAVHCYGGRLSTEALSSLEVLNHDLREACDVLEMGTQQVKIADEKGAVREYQFLDSTLWREGQPLMSGIGSFCFEFRDEWGNLLTVRRQNCDGVQSIGYTFRIQSRSTEIFVRSQKGISHNATQEKLSSSEGKGFSL